jgi:hypothetical protein
VSSESIQASFLGAGIGNPEAQNPESSDSGREGGRHHTTCGRAREREREAQSRWRTDGGLPGFWIDAWSVDRRGAAAAERRASLSLSLSLCCTVVRGAKEEEEGTVEFGVRTPSLPAGGLLIWVGRQGWLQRPKPPSLSSPLLPPCCAPAAANRCWLGVCNAHLPTYLPRARPPGGRSRNIHPLPQFAAPFCPHRPTGGARACWGPNSQPPGGCVRSNRT